MSALTCIVCRVQTVAGARQVGFAFNRIESALSYLVNHMGKFSGLAAQTERLDALFAGMHPAPIPWTTRTAAAAVTAGLGQTRDCCTVS